MTNLFTTIQNKYDPYFVGFNRMFDQLADFDANISNVRKESKYPPYNLIQDGDKYTIELAVAGFSQNDIEIIHEPGSGQIIIEGQLGSSDGTYLHQGIANRSFRRIWTVSDTIVVHGASLSGGILSVELESVVPEEKKPKKITINNAELLNG